MADNKPPDRQGHPYQPPKTLLSNEQLEKAYDKKSGVRAEDVYCLRCGHERGEAHRLQWLDCAERCILCNRCGHRGTWSSRMELCYPHFFTEDFFRERALAPIQPWAISGVEMLRAATFVRLGILQSAAQPAAPSQLGVSRGRDPSSTTTYGGRDERKRTRSASSHSQEDCRSKKGRTEELHDELQRLQEKERIREIKRELENTSLAPASSSPTVTKSCFKCGKPGHLSRNCPEQKKCLTHHPAESVSGSQTVACTICGKFGHAAKDCKPCFTCGKPGHFSRNCPEQEKGANTSAAASEARPVSRITMMRQWKKDARTNAGRDDMDVISTPDLQEQLQAANAQIALLKSELAEATTKLSEAKAKLVKGEIKLKAIMQGLQGIIIELADDNEAVPERAAITPAKEMPVIKHEED